MQLSLSSSRFPLRWIAVSVIALSSTLNYLDRQILAALAPRLMSEFHLKAGDYGYIITAFSITYAFTAPLAGLFIDRVGLRLGSSLAVGAWSLASIATGFVESLRGLIACRASLGIAEAAGIPGTGKAAAIYLEPNERAFGSAVSQIGLTLGSLGAPLAAEWISARYGWRATFVMAGAMGFVWIPIWLLVARRAPQSPLADAPRVPLRSVLTDRRYWCLLASNVLLMTIYSLWVNWTTVFLVRTHGLSQLQANSQLAWIPPIFATAGGLTGGWLSFRWSASQGAIGAKLRAFRLGAFLALSSAVVPFLPSPQVATAGICLSFFACVVASVNLYALPLDIFGPGRAAFCVAGLTSAYGFLQAVFSPLVGRVVDRVGFSPVCIGVALLPLIAYSVVRVSTKET
jgi:MFS transporter, ACS family, hexuronate transporter